jgi:hypothetical protein
MLDLNAFLRIERQQGRTRPAPVVAIEVARVLHSGNAQRSDNPLIRHRDALLFFPRQGKVMILPGEVNLLARLWRERGET